MACNASQRHNRNVLFKVILQAIVSLHLYAFHLFLDLIVRIDLDPSWQRRMQNSIDFSRIT